MMEKTNDNSRRTAVLSALAIMAAVVMAPPAGGQADVPENGFLRDIDAAADAPAAGQDNNAWADFPFDAGPEPAVEAEEWPPEPDAPVVEEALDPALRELLGEMDEDADAPAPEEAPEGIDPEPDPDVELEEWPPEPDAPVVEEALDPALLELLGEIDEGVDAPAPEEAPEEIAPEPDPDVVLEEWPPEPDAPVVEEALDPALLELLRDLDRVDEPAPEEEPVVLEAPPERHRRPERPAPPPSPRVVAEDVSEEELARRIAIQEELRRQALEIEARRRFEEARAAAARREYSLAARLYDIGIRRLPVRPETEALLRSVRREHVEVLFHVFQADLRAAATRDQAVEARDRIRASLQTIPEHRGLQRLLVDAERAIERLAPPPPSRIYETDEIRARRERVKTLIEDARGFLRTLDLDRAQELFETVLSIEPDNPEAMRYLQELHTQRYLIGSIERQATQRAMIADVRETWRPREYEDAELPPDDPEDPRRRPTDDLLQRMERIVIREIEFRQANIHDVVEFLVRASIEADPDPEKRGVNIILNLRAGRPAEEAAPPPDDPWADFTAPSAAPGADINVTFTARYISLLQALKIITSVSGLKYHIQDDIVMIVPHDAVIDRIEHRMYPVEPSLMELVERERDVTMAQPDPFRGVTMGPGRLDRERPPVQQFFEQMGVPFPPGSSIAYRASLGKLVVANTAENLMILERILPELNVVPFQVEIEARFVEINQTDLEEFGLHWLLEDNWQVLQRRGQDNLPMSARERIEIRRNAASGGFTRGLRFANPAGELPISGGQGTLGSIMTISSVLTNPEFSLVINALAQKGHADVLSAPKVTTRAGQEANIRVVTEYIYPTDYDIREITGSVDGQQVVLDAFTIPSAFETREVGVILSVLPEVSPDGNMINLTLRPEVTDEPIWRNYGAVIRRADGSEQQTNMEQPFFPTRTLTTQISIYDGATVVMGGLITENIITADDKIPFFGDLPLLGRLFRSSVKRSIKRNLLIFVTARLVDPAGRPIRTPRAETISAMFGPEGVTAR